ncbi:lantibiotic dehydratase [Hymenobacter terrestris]|uniref:Lantibiotic dehydratase n=1 Tax=Hymenobacter terrestris TaxID=2748310 RepID=A0ABX2Q4V3_9BACT|nr:lantibiotic dehydratase [Hymenobacter terrestris]NVO85873.1 lantibiotic dehydratase [Hymenobacter terrestris]
MKNTYFDKAVVRVPLYSLDYYQQFFADDQTALPALVRDETFLSGLYLASPQLYYAVRGLAPGELLADNKKARKLRLTLAKYVNRLSTRCTPFGLFAGCAVVEVQPGASALELAAPEHYRQHTRLDSQYLFSLTSQLSAEAWVRPYLRYTVSTSLYQLGEAYRYVEYSYRGTRRKYQLVSVGQHPYIDRLLALLRAAPQGLNIPNMAASLADADVTADEAAQFVERLIEAQILVSNLELGTTGAVLEEQALAVLRELQHAAAAEPAHVAALGNLLAYLGQLRHDAQAVDAESIAGKMHGYQRLKALATEFKHPFEESSLLQTDLTTTFAQGQIDSALAEQVQKGAEVLSRLAASRPNAKLDKFRKAFEERYDARVVPLVEALDIESGIGYGNFLDDPRSDISELIGGLRFSSTKAADEKTTLSTLHTDFWLPKLLDAQRRQATVVNLTDADLAPYPFTGQRLTTTYSAMTSLYQDADGQPVVCLQGVTGPTAATWLGRFGNQDAGMHALMQQVAAVEEAAHADKLVAEITHLPEARLGNVLQRPALRRYEIPYLASSAVDTEYQLPIQDLMLCIRDNRLVLFSQRHQREVLPYLTNAHYYGNGKSLPLYHFLCDMQELNGMVGMVLELEPLRKLFRHLPRITYGNVILKRASWVFTQQELAPVLQAPDAQLPAAFAAFAQQHGLPSTFSIAKGDNELVIKSDSLLLLQAFVDEVKDMYQVMLNEVLFAELRPLVSNGQAAFNNETLFFFQREAVTGPGFRRPLPVAHVKREYMPGSEWLYFNLYTGFKNADHLLQRVGWQLEQLYVAGIIDKWFFIRYYDPKFHVRLRLHLVDARRYDEVFNVLHPLLERLKEQRIVWKVGVDTYQRELERYGFDKIEPVENIFFHDSRLCVRLLQRLSRESSEETRWLACLASIDGYFDLFGLDLAARKAFAETMHSRFAQEFNATGLSARILDKKYRDQRTAIVGFLAGTHHPALAADVACLVQERNDSLCADAARLRTVDGPSILSYLDSLVHMHVNRLFRTQQRVYELVLYGFLRKYYTSLLAQQAVPA